MIVTVTVGMTTDMMTMMWTVSVLAAVWGERPATSASRAVRRWSPGMDRTTMTLAGLMVLAWRSVIVFGPVGWLFSNTVV